MKSKYPLAALSVACTFVILYFSALPAGAAGPAGVNPSGEAVHFVVYAAYAALVAVTLCKLPAKRPLPATLAIAAALGAATELLQLFVPGRFCDSLDWLTDVAGALAGLAALFLLSRRTRSFHENKPQTA